VRGLDPLVVDLAVLDAAAVRIRRAVDLAVATATITAVAIAVLALLWVLLKAHQEVIQARDTVDAVVVTRLHPGHLRIEQSPKNKWCNLCANRPNKTVGSMLETFPTMSSGII
jgi:hypothetical protein